MLISLQDKLSQLPPERQAQIRARADQLIAEKMSLRDRLPDQ